jgi:predicted enzyme related to lactoylglutathione lyase
MSEAAGTISKGSTAAIDAHPVYAQEMIAHSSRFPVAGLIALLVGNAVPLCASAAGFELPALTRQASAEHHTGKIIWADLVTPDPTAAKQFYGALFGWTFRDVPGDPNYTLALIDDEPVAGLFHKAVARGEKRQPAWLTFLSVPDVDAAQRTVVANGGRVLSKPRTFAGRGRQAVFTDPDGAVFAVMAAQGGDPPDYLAAPGEWIWSSVLVSDAKRETAFYRSLFNYEIYDLASEQGESNQAERQTENDGRARHFVLAREEFARAGLNVLPADAVRRHAHWMNFIRVTDATIAVQKAVSLGGRVLVEPRADRHGGMLAILADPSGAPFGVMDWSEADAPQEQQ